jgi:hypothetical protein
MIRRECDEAVVDPVVTSKGLEAEACAPGPRTNVCGRPASTPGTGGSCPARAKSRMPSSEAVTMVSLSITTVMPAASIRCGKAASGGGWRLICSETSTTVAYQAGARRWFGVKPASRTRTSPMFAVRTASSGGRRFRGRRGGPRPCSRWRAPSRRAQAWAHYLERRPFMQRRNAYGCRPAPDLLDGARPGDDGQGHQQDLEVKPE